MSEIWNLSTLCRCCHSDGCFKKLNLPYQSENAIEIYEFMLQETLGIKIIQPTVDQASYTICDTCIKRLQEASKFREQVLACEQKFKIYFTNEQFLHSGVQLENVKAEVGSNDTEYYDVNDDDDVQRDDDGVQPDDCDKTPATVKEEIKIEVEISPSIVTKDEKSSVTESIKKEPKAVVKKCKQRATPGGRIRRKALPSFNPRSKFLKTYVITKKDTNGVTYSCKNCEGTYDTRRAIYRHIHTHHRDRCKCEQCGKSFEFVTHLEKHIKIQHGKVYGCQHCGRKYDSKKRLNAHEKTHNHDQIYKCDICQKELRYKATLRKHILSLHTDNIKAVLCDVCGRSFSQRCNLEAHIQAVHLKLRPHACTICGKTYTAKKHLKNHIEIAHSDNPKPYQCVVCTKSFGCPKYYKIHKLTHENHFGCRYCSEVFDNKKDLNIHVKTHTCRHLLNSPYSCHVCGKVLLSRFTLKRHVDSHNGIRRFSCDICGLKFTQKMLLKRHHLRKHDPSVKIEKVKCDLCKRLVRNIEKHMDSHDADKRKCFCDLCGKNYYTNNALNRHKQQKHFGASYDCDICGKKYIKKGSLQTHKLKIHKIKKEILDNVASVENMEPTSEVV